MQETTAKQLRGLNTLELNHKLAVNLDDLHLILDEMRHRVVAAERAEGQYVPRCNGKVVA